MKNVIIDDMGTPFINKTDTAKELMRQYVQFCDRCPKAYDFTCSGENARECDEKKQALLDSIYDITDTRRMCVVTSREQNIPCVRHIFRVSEDAKDRLEDVKSEYYADYKSLDTDEFHFFTGYHNAEAFAQSWGKGENI